MHFRFVCSMIVLASISAVSTVSKADAPNWSADIATLSATNTAERAKAAADLARLADSPDAAKIAAAMTAALPKAPTAARYEIAKLLGDYGKNAKASIPALISLLKDDKDDLVRAVAARSLGWIADATSDAVPALADAIVDKDARVRRNAVRSLIRIHPGPVIGLPLYVKALQDADPAVVADILATAAEVGDKVVPVATAGLKDPKARYWALLLLGEVGPAAKSATPEVEKLLTDEQVEVRMHAAMTLGEIGPDAKAAVPALIKALDDPQAAVRFGAAYALGRIGDKGATKPLEKQMSGKGSAFLQTVCAWALVQINPDDKDMAAQAVKLLADSLASKNVNVRRGAAKGLAELRVAPEGAIAALIAAMADADPQVVDSVSQALAKWGGKHVDEIAATLKDKNRLACAVRTLGRMGPDAKEAVSALAAAMKDAPPDSRREVLFALAKIGPNAAAAVPQVQAQLADDSLDVQYAAIYVLGKIGPAAKSAVPALQKNLASKDEFLTMASVWALLQIEGKDEELVKIAVPLFTKLLKDEHELRRIEAAHALGELGPAAAPALPLLKDLAESDTPSVRSAAAAAVGKIGGGQK